MPIEKQYTVYASLHADIESGYIWLANLDFKYTRSVFRVRNVANGKMMYVVALGIEENFKRQYQNGRTIKNIQWSQAAILNSWYRSKLGIEKTRTPVTLRITRVASWNRVCACLDHPNVSVRIGAWLGMIGIGLGVLGFCFALK